MKIALLQFDPEFGAVDRNLDHIERALADRSFDLVVLPELCTSGYLFRDRAELDDLCEPIDGPSLKRLQNLARSLQGHLVLGFAEQDGERRYNSAALVGPDGVAGLYRKIHLFSDEKRLFDPGDRGFKVFQIGAVRLGIMICFDWLFPESARSLALLGAQLIAHPANLVLPYCQAAMITRAIENRVFTATCNRIGSEDRAGQALRFTGGSRLVSPAGQVLAEGSLDGEQLLVAEIDPALALDKHITPHNDLFADRRPGQYRLD